MTVAAQKALSFFFYFFMLAEMIQAAQLRTWTFSQDGQMKTSAGGTVSFKRNGRIDAVFIKVESTNSVVLLAGHGDYLRIATTNLSGIDRSYIIRESGLDRLGSTSTLQPAITKNEISRRRFEAARLSESAAAKRRLSQAESEAADGLEDQAAKLSTRAKALKQQALGAETVADVSALSTNQSNVLDEAFVKTPGNAAIVKGAADQLEHDAALLRTQASEKRQKAASLEKEAVSLERTAEAELASLQQITAY